jgi:ferrochelatase
MSENIKSKKIAIVIFNLGGPDSQDAVKPFLFNLFNDKYIITLPRIFRYMIAWLISARREKTAQKIYSLIGNKSPILQETTAQKEALEQALQGKLNATFEIFIAMRHWHPMPDEVAMKVKEYSPDEIILLPLYPQFSTTTTASFVEDFKRAIKEINFDNIPLKTICCYPTDQVFIKSHVEIIKQSVKDKKDYRMLFSAHGLPEKIIKSGDPYQWQIEQTVGNIVGELGIDNLDYKITYQSRVGPMKWIGPNTEDEIKLAVQEKKSLVIIPIAFVSEHVETLVELDIEYKHIADNGGIDYTRIPTLRADSNFTNSLANLVVAFASYKGNITASNEMNRICPGKYSSCPCKI